jgi:phenylacetate-CoA ligase
MSFQTKLYENLPVWGQQCAVSAYGAYWHWVRFGSGYVSDLKGYLSRESLSATEWNKWQRKSLTNLLNIAAANIPYYRNVWSKSDRRAALAGELKDLPLLEKEQIRSEPNSLCRDDVRPWPCFEFHTSGTTGTPIRTVWTLGEIRNSMALREARSARWAGTSFRLPRATFSGRISEPNPKSTGPFYRCNLIERQIYFSPFHLRPNTARFYVEALWKHGIQWMTGYAVSYYLLAKMILEQGLEVPKLRAVITTSEKLTESMKLVMERAYRTRVYEEYSTVESAVFASECSHGRLHVSPDAGIVEILRQDGTPCGPGEPGEVVATSLIRKYQVFVRYRLGDVAAWHPEPCPCGLSMPVIQEVLGRVEDIVIGPDGRRMVRFHGIFTDQPHIREGQIVQERLDWIRVKVVTSEGFGERDVRDVRQRVIQRVGPGVEVTVESVESIPRSSSGKFQAVVSLLSSEEVEPTGVHQ